MIITVILYKVDKATSATPAPIHAPTVASGLPFPAQVEHGGRGQGASNGSGSAAGGSSGEGSAAADGGGGGGGGGGGESWRGHHLLHLEAYDPY